MDPEKLGFDAAVEFQPKLRLIPAPMAARIKGKILPKLPNTHISSYAELVRNSLDEMAAALPEVSMCLSGLGQYTPPPKPWPNLETFYA